MEKLRHSQMVALVASRPTLQEMCHKKGGLQAEQRDAVQQVEGIQRNKNP